MGRALTSGYSCDVNTPRSKPHLSLGLPSSLLLSLSFRPLIPHLHLVLRARGPAQVIYLSVKILVMTARREAPGPWH